MEVCQEQRTICVYECVYSHVPFFSTLLFPILCRVACSWNLYTFFEILEPLRPLRYSPALMFVVNHTGCSHPPPCCTPSPTTGRPNPWRCGAGGAPPVRETRRRHIQVAQLLPSSEAWQRATLYRWYEENRPYRKTSSSNGLQPNNDGLHLVASCD